MADRGSALLKEGEPVRIAVDARTPDALRLPAAVSSNDPFAEEMEALSTVDHFERRVRWRKLTRTARPVLPGWLLAGLITYRMQARVHGELDPETARYLRQIDEERRRGLETSAAERRESKALPPIPRVPGI